MSITVEAPLNSLSLGQVTIGLLQEFKKKNIDVNLLPIGNQADLGGYDFQEDFKVWLKGCIEKGLSSFKRTDKALKIWHTQGSHSRVGAESFLYTFHELDSLTNQEINILNQWDKVFVACDFNKGVFNLNGVNNVVTAPLGFSDHFKEVQMKAYPEHMTCWLITGKYEQRKAHNKAIEGWYKKFGKSQNHVLHIACQNPFLKPEEEIKQILQHLKLDHKPFNLNFIPYCPRNSDYNRVLNVSDIVIDMSRGESFSLPSFTCVGLGKHALVHNNTGMKQWATSANSILVPSFGKMDSMDGVFFHKGQMFNQGSYFDWDMAAYEKGLDDVLTRKVVDKVNHEGKKIQTDFTWDQCATTILSEMGV